jgi:adenine-specific DNA-methyltransferase
MLQQSIINELIKTLSSIDSFIVDDKLNKTLIVDAALKLDEELLSALQNNKKLSTFFFKKINNILIFDKILFENFLTNKQLLPDSFTKYKKKIGLNTSSITNSFHNVVLEWPYKDCLLEGGQTNQSENRQEIFWNGVIAKDEIENLLTPKTLTNFQFHGNSKKDNLLNENQVIFGNNLIALHSLKKVYENKIQTIYCDPPYNKGKDTFGYNDRFNHSTWLTFIKNRLEICRDLLKPSGTIWINLDDTESHYAKVLMDEVFGRDNFIANVIWEKKYAPQNDAKFFTDNHDHILVYAKDINATFFRGLPRTKEANSRYKNLDDDPRGDWKPSDLSAKRYTKEYDYTITTPSGREVNPPQGVCWRVKKEKFDELVKDNRIWFGKDGTNVPSLKRFLSEIKDTITPMTIWSYSDVGHNQDANRELSKFYNLEEFKTPKPEKLLKRILDISSNESDIVLDAFAGSGTTAAVALKMNRKFIVCEQMDYGEDIICKRLNEVIKGENGGISKEIDWKGGGGFVSYELKKLNLELIEKIKQTNSIDELKMITKEIMNHDYLSIQKDIKNIFSEISKSSKDEIDNAKEALKETLDKSQLYLSFSEIRDKKNNISNEDLELNELFYQ